jgi:hypothetical protein
VAPLIIAASIATIVVYGSALIEPTGARVSTQISGLSGGQP